MSGQCIKIDEVLDEAKNLSGITNSRDDQDRFESLESTITTKYSLLRQIPAGREIVFRGGSRREFEAAKGGRKLAAGKGLHPHGVAC